MGVSTDGILAYGINFEEGEEFWKLGQDFDEDEEDEDREEMDFETWWAEQNNVSSKHLWDEYYAWEKDQKNGEYEHDSKLVDKYEKENPGWRKALSKYYEDNRRVQAECPVELVYHCSYDYPMYILAVKGFYFDASRGNPEEIKPEDMVLTEEALDAFQDFVDTYKIEGTPKWWLASMWG